MNDATADGGGAAGDDAGMKVVVIASEAVPFAKTGGLADVAGALPRALERQGHAATLFVPCYRRVRSAGLPLSGTGLLLSITFGAKVVEAHVHKSRLPDSDVSVYLIDQPGYFDRDGIYGIDGADY